MSNQEKCYLCGNSRFVQKPGSVRDNAELKILECTSCGLVFLSSFAHIKDNFYENSKMHGDESLDIEAWIRETEWDDLRRYRYLVDLLPNRSLLDFGCGTGNFLFKARKLTAKAHGVECEKRLKKHYQEHNLTVFQTVSEIPDSMSFSGYNIVTMFHVLEHIPDPKSILFELNKLLAKGGQIIVEVPNADDALLSLLPISAIGAAICFISHQEL